MLTKILSAIFGTLLCLPTCLYAGFWLAYLITTINKVPGFEGAAATNTLYLTLIITPILALCCGVAHAIFTSDHHPTTAYMIEALLIIPAVLLTWQAIR